MAQLATNLREQDLTELLLVAAELEKQMFDVRQRLVTKEENDTSLLRALKKDYARVLTVIREKQVSVGA
jgi:ribosomal protein L29